MIKKFLLGLFVGFIGFVSFSYGYQVFIVGLDKTSSNWENSYDVGILSKGRFITNYLGTAKPLLGVASKDLFFWGPAGSLYYYSENLQGYFQYIYSCDKIDMQGTGDYLQNCGSTQKIDLGSELVGNFINTIVAGDVVYVDLNHAQGDWCGQNCYNYHAWARICFSSSVVDKTLCFFGNNNHNYDRLSALTGSMQLPNTTNFAGINRSLLNEPPGFDFGNGDGGSSISQSTNLSGNLVYNTCTNGYIVNKLNNIYGYDYKYVCYAGTDNTGSVTSDYELSNTMPGLGMNIIDLYHLTSNGQSWNDWFNSNAYAIQKFREGRLNANPFLSSPIALYSYFDILYDESFIPSSCIGDDPSCPYTILNYCKLLLFSDYNESYGYEYFKSYCDDLNSSNGDVVLTTGDVGSVDGSGELLPGGTDIGGNNGSVTNSGTVTSVDWSGVLSGNTNQNFDGKTFINNVYQKFQSKLIKPYYGSTIGIIPNWILVFLFALILFRFLQH